jgi:para-aminobenzoate synthetase / 4-amino-4-deoxychorismate lyase
MEIYIGFEGQHRIFRQPLDEFVAWNLAEVPGVFAAVERALYAGCYVAGFLAYDAGYAFEPLFAQAGPNDFPLAHFGVFERLHAEPLPAARSGSAVLERTLAIDAETYGIKVQKIRDYIQRGDVYQITYCVRNLIRYEGDPGLLFRRLLARQPVPYPAYLASPGYSILSLSPELFFRKCGTHITTKPMKGTWRRGNNILTDWLNRRRLHFDEKNRAENVMIADLMRNDLGRVGTMVRVPKLFEVASYTTLHQMTSTVTAQVPADIPTLNLFAALFPSGSVTGAPKIRAMQIIREIEDAPRRIHTGAIGFMTPAREMFFNVAIRTLLLRGNAGEMGVGGGIVWDSTPQGEFEECQIKSAFLS